MDERFEPAANVAEAEAYTPPPASAQPAAAQRSEARPAPRGESERPKVDLSKAALVWETPTSTPTRPEAGEARFGRQAPKKTGRPPGTVPASVDPTRRPTVSEAPASAPRHTSDAPSTPRAPSAPLPRVEAEVHEVKSLPSLDASRYRAAESPASSFASESPTAWDEEPKEHE